MKSTSSLLLLPVLPLRPPSLTLARACSAKGISARVQTLVEVPAVGAASAAPGAPVGEEGGKVHVLWVHALRNM